MSLKSIKRHLIWKVPHCDSILGIPICGFCVRHYALRIAICAYPFADTTLLMKLCVWNIQDVALMMQLFVFGLTRSDFRLQYWLFRFADSNWTVLFNWYCFEDDIARLILLVSLFSDYALCMARCGFHFPYVAVRMLSCVCDFVHRVALSGFAHIRLRILASRFILWECCFTHSL